MRRLVQERPPAGDGDEQHERNRDATGERAFAHAPVVRRRRDAAVAAGGPDALLRGRRILEPRLGRQHAWRLHDFSQEKRVEIRKRGTPVVRGEGSLLAHPLDERLRVHRHRPGIRADDAVQVGAIGQAFEVAVFERLDSVQLDPGAPRDFFRREPRPFARLPEVGSN